MRDVKTTLKMYTVESYFIDVQSSEHAILQLSFNKPIDEIDKVKCVEWLEELFENIKSKLNES